MIRCILIAGLFASPASAEEFDGVTATQILSDADFFRMVTCGAPPGGACRGPTLRWPGPEVTVALVPGQSNDERSTADRIAPALDRAIADINRVGAGLTLRRVGSADADIRIHMTETPEGTQLPEEPGISAAGIMGVGYMTLWSDDADRITAASALISTTFTDADIPSVMLGELFQTLGPRFDVEGPAYGGVSIVSQTSNATTTIAGQDAALLLRLYPKP